MKREITLSKILILVAVVFVAEMFVMFLLFRLEADFPWAFEYRIVEAFGDALGLSLLIAPFIYWLLVRPLQFSYSIKSRFLDMVSDQLRNPLNALQGLEAICQGGRNDPLDKARVDALRMMQLRIDHIVAFSALQAGQPLACNGVKTLAELGTEAHRRIAFAFENSGIGIEIATGKTDVPLGDMDAEALLQVVLTMLELAKVTPGSSNVVLSTQILRQGKWGTRVRIIVSHDGNERAQSAYSKSNDMIALTQEIVVHMARQIGARFRIGRARELVLEVMLPADRIAA